MFYKSAIRKTLPLAAGLLFLAAPALPDPWNKKTYLTFSHSIELPGQVTLPPGTYTMKVVDSPSNRHTVMVQNRDENKVYATFFTIPKYRERPPDKTLITFHETPGSHPRFIKAWFYPGDTIGREFLYSRERQTYIAGLIRSGSSTTTEETQVVASSTPPPVVTESESTQTQVNQEERAAGGGDVKVAGNAAVPEDAPAPEPLPEPPAPAPAPTPEPLPEQPAPAAPTELPRTASPMALIALGGLTMFGSAGWLRLRRKS